MRTPEAQAASKNLFPWSTFSAQVATSAESLGQLRRGDERSKEEKAGTARCQGECEPLATPGAWRGGRRLAPRPTPSSPSRPAAVGFSPELPAVFSPTGKQAG